MLILTRRVGESVVIGEDVTVTVLGVKGNQVRIGINAPKHVAVHREEIFERIKNGRGRPARRRRRIRQPSSPPHGKPCPPRAILDPFLPRPLRVFMIAPPGEMAEWSKAHPC